LPAASYSGITNAVEQAKTIRNPIQRAQVLTSSLRPAEVEISKLLAGDTLIRFRKAIIDGRF
jgi:hypothetical protein